MDIEKKVTHFQTPLATGDPGKVSIQIIIICPEDNLKLLPCRSTGISVDHRPVFRGGIYGYLEQRHPHWQPIISLVGHHDLDLNNRIRTVSDS